MTHHTDELETETTPATFEHMLSDLQLCLAAAGTLCNELMNYRVENELGLPPGFVSINTDELEALLTERHRLNIRDDLREKFWNSFGAALQKYDSRFRCAIFDIAHSLDHCVVYPDERH